MHEGEGAGNPTNRIKSDSILPSTRPVQCRNLAKIIESHPCGPLYTPHTLRNLAKIIERYRQVQIRVSEKWLNKVTL